jgi:dTDP-4-amino-4,6-dideoxygalactose transaminase
MSNLAVLGGTPAVTEKAPAWPAVGEQDIENVVAALRASADDPSNLTSVMPGGVVQDFEHACEALFGAHCITTNSGGAALHAALMACGVGAGDEVIVSPYTWGQSVSCVLQQCAVPVFADIDPLTYTLDPASVESAISPYTRAIVVPHIYGLPADLDALSEIATRHGLYLIEDCAQATGAAVGDRRAGTIGDIGCFSIGSGKQIIGGEGGFLLTRDDEMRDRLLLASQHPVRSGQQIRSDELRSQIDNFIYTHRIHPLAAAICRGQLDHLDEWNDCRRAQLHGFSEKIRDVPGIDPVFEPAGRIHVFHSYTATYRAEEVDGLDRTRLVEALRAEGVVVLESYVGTPLHLTPRFQQRRWHFGGGLPWSMAQREISYAAGAYPVAEQRCATLDLSIYLGPNLYRDSSAYVAQVADAVTKVLTGAADLRVREEPA